MDLPCFTYNFIPKEHSKKSAFILIFGWDPVTLLGQLLWYKIDILDIKNDSFYGISA